MHARVGRETAISGTAAAVPDRSCSANHEKLSCSGILSDCAPRLIRGQTLESDFQKWESDPHLDEDVVEMSVHIVYIMYQDKCRNPRLLLPGRSMPGRSIQCSQDGASLSRFDSETE